MPIGLSIKDCDWSELEKLFEKTGKNGNTYTDYSMSVFVEKKKLERQKPKPPKEGDQNGNL